MTNNNSIDEAFQKHIDVGMFDSVVPNQQTDFKTET